MLLEAARTRIGLLVSDQAIRLNVTLLSSLDRLLRDLIGDGGPLPQVVPAISGGIEVQWLVGDQFVGLIVDETGQWLLWNETASGSGFEIEGAPGEPVPPNRRVELHNQLANMGRSARFWAGSRR